MGVGEVQRQQPGEELELGRGRVVEVEHTPTHAVGFGRWLVEELARVELAGPVPEETYGECDGDGCG